MKANASFIALACAAFAAAGAVPSAAGAASAEADWHGTVPAGTTVEIHNPNGNVFVQRSDDATLSIRAVSRDGSAQPSLVTARGGNDLVACTAAAGTPCAAGPLTGAGSGAPVDELVLVPAGVNVVVRAVEGKVVAEHAPADVRAYTVDGDIDASAAGAIEAWTTNGSIQAAPGRVDGRLEFRTKNGSIAVSAPKNADRSAIDAQSGNGNVTVTNG